MGISEAEWTQQRRGAWAQKARLFINCISSLLFHYSHRVSGGLGQDLSAALRGTTPHPLPFPSISTQRRDPSSVLISFNVDDPFVHPDFDTRRTNDPSLTLILIHLDFDARRWGDPDFDSRRSYDPCSP